MSSMHCCCRPCPTCMGLALAAATNGTPRATALLFLSVEKRRFVWVIGWVSGNLPMLSREVIRLQWDCLAPLSLCPFVPWVLAVHQICLLPSCEPYFAPWPDPLTMKCHFLGVYMHWLWTVTETELCTLFIQSFKSRSNKTKDEKCLHRRDPGKYQRLIDVRAET